jgi:hypothetical protein
VRPADRLLDPTQKNILEHAVHSPILGVSEDRVHQITTKVDGEPVPSGIVGVMPQKDPFPGGVVLEVTIFTTKRHEFKDYPRVGEVFPDEKQSRYILNTLEEFYCADEIPPGGRRWYFNRVTRALFTETEIYLYGIGSPIVRSRPTVS